MGAGTPSSSSNNDYFMPRLSHQVGVVAYYTFDATNNGGSRKMQQCYSLRHELPWYLRWTHTCDGPRRKQVMRGRLPQNAAKLTLLLGGAGLIVARFGVRDSLLTNVAIYRGQVVASGVKKLDVLRRIHKRL